MIKNIRVQENYQRGDVRGIGALISQEKPILGIQCSFSCSSYVISVAKLGTIDNPFVSMYLSKKIDAELSVLDSTKKIFLRWLRHVM